MNPHPAYPGMTAIDFHGHNDTGKTLGNGALGFYQPLLDCGGLVSVVNRNETQNLLVYAPDATAQAQTFNVLSGYFTDPDCVESTEGYRSVAVPQSQPATICSWISKTLTVLSLT